MPAQLSPIERSVLQSLADGRDDIQTAAQLRVPVSTVAAIQQRFGPSVDRIRQVLDADEVAQMPAPPTPIRPQRPLGARPGASPIEDLLVDAERHTLAKIRNKAERIRGQIDQLRAAIDEEREQEQARKKEAAEREAALAEIAKLEQQLAAARAKIPKKSSRPKNPRPDPAFAAKSAVNMRKARADQAQWLIGRSVTYGQVLKWASERGIQTRGSLLSNATKQAWDEAHQKVAS